MKLEQFLQSGSLRPDTVEAAITERVTAEPGLHEAFAEYDPSPATLVDLYVAQIAAVLGDKPPAEAGMKKGTLRKMHFQLTKWNNAKVREAVALAHSIGALTRPDALHVHDVCGGKGQVAVFVAFVRKHLGLDTTGICWELQADQIRGHDRIKRWLKYPDAPVEFRPSDIAHADLTTRTDMATVCMGKHTCGGLADVILAKVRALAPADQPEASVVMTCCHSLLKGDEPFWPADMALDMRLAIAEAADPHRGKERDAYKRDMLAVTARRYVDALRAKHYGGQAYEVLPYGTMSNRNNAVRIKREEPNEVSQA